MLTKSTRSQKNIAVFFIVTLVLLSVLPVLNFIKKPHELSTEKLFNTDVIESLINQVFLTLFNRSLRPMDVITGKDGFLFLGENYNHLISQTQNHYPHRHQDIENWVNNLKTIQQWYTSKDIHFVMSVVPNKHTVYHDKLPNWLIINQQNIAQKLITSARQQGINMIDSSHAFANKRKHTSQLLYHKKDSHWSQLGATIGYETILDKLNHTYHESLLKVPYQFKNAEVRAGDLHFIMKVIPHNLDYTAQTQHYYFTEPQSICHGSIDKNNHQLQSCVTTENQSFQIHAGPYYVINDKALNDNKVLLLADSFSTQTARLFHRTFTNVLAFHYNQLVGDDLRSFVEKHKPDLVIYQIVERNLYDNKFINAVLH